MSDAYQQFLARKRIMDPATGLSDPGELLPAMKPHQRVIADDSLAERITLSWRQCGSDVRVVLTKWEAGR